ncbi:MAG TPA: IlvD/Edd family dehydratase [Blastocatellia bacterium]|nr:IlvD/Edd family dehydratase [Blastocatellia bacterium]HMV84215.1 IlvD/Edd family dehydratase [Blastocatellia bacterium]HMX26672.1 IlvD/Edd family dehydratase [Blastocatellia bacterium]HNG28917.1 IlvD/Edd family dehydratase [Blastocatellia bacterium]
MTSERKFRSSDWFGKLDKSGFIHRSWMKNQGHPDHVFDGRPVIGICNTWSELTPCNGHFRQLAEHVKRGVYEAGGFPVEFPVLSLGEPLLRPTAMLFRNLASMDVEESIRGNPMDGVILLAGCDKTTPALLMGAASCDLPSLMISGGPMLNGKYRGADIGSGTQVWQFSEMVRSGEMSLCDFQQAEGCMSRSTGHCMTMGTASTMASLVEALGIGLPTNAAIPAVDSRRYALAHLAGRRIVEMVHEDLRMSKILTRQAFENAVRVLAAIGGSTNAVVHLLAIAGRLGLEFTLDDIDQLGRGVPCLVNLAPSGKYLMEDFYYAGGVPVVIRELGDLIHGDALTVNGHTIGENNVNAECFNREVIHTVESPFKPDGGIAILRGNLAPNGAVLKPSAATPELMQHRGRAVVFENIEDLHARIDDENLDIDETCVMVMKNCGPKGYPGMAEVGNMPLPPKLLRRGITDMVRISDARMSGTAYGTVVLHVAPEAAAGGTLALVQNGDFIELDVAARKLHLDVTDDELARRRALWTPPPAHSNRGYTRLYVDHVLQADQGADLDFLVGHSGTEVTRDSH